MPRPLARARSAVVTAACACALAAGAALPAHGQTPGIRGSWHAEEYVLASGDRYPVTGQIHFTAEDWLVLFFVLEDDRPVRASAEGGRFTLEEDRLTFEHLHHLSTGAALPGLPESPLRMETRRSGGALEAARVAVEDDRLTLFFPSGNRMRFRRAPQ